MWVWSLCWEVPLEEGMASHSRILACRISRIEEPGGLWSVGSQRVRHDWSDWACTQRNSNIQNSAVACSRKRRARIFFLAALVFVVVSGLSSCAARAQLPHSLWDLNSLTGSRTHASCIERWVLNHCTTREVPEGFLVGLPPPSLELLVLCRTEMNAAQGVVESVQKGGKQEGGRPWGWVWAAMSGCTRGHPAVVMNSPASQGLNQA